MVAEISISQREGIVVGIGEIHTTRSTTAVITCIGLGSCVALCMYDADFHVGGMVHVVLPTCFGKDENNPAKYADTAVPLLIAEMAKQGVRRSSLIVKIAGGAQMSMAGGLNNTFKTGDRNVAEIETALKKEGLRVASADVGGSRGRTVRMYMETGKITVRTIGDIEREF